MPNMLFLGYLLFLKWLFNTVVEIILGLVKHDMDYCHSKPLVLAFQIRQEKSTFLPMAQHAVRTVSTVAVVVKFLRHFTSILSLASLLRWWWSSAVATFFSMLLEW